MTEFEEIEAFKKRREKKELWRDPSALFVGGNGSGREN